MTSNTTYDEDLFETLLMLGKLLGFNRSVASVFAILYSHEDALSLDEIAELSYLSKSTVSMAIRDLAQLGAVHEVMAPGQRTRHYCGQPDLTTVTMELIISKLKFPLSRLRDKLDNVSGKQSRCEQVRALLETADSTLETIQAINRSDVQ